MLGSDLVLAQREERIKLRDEKEKRRREKCELSVRGIKKLQSIRYLVPSKTFIMKLSYIIINLSV